MVRFGCLLSIIGFVAMFALFVIPVMPPFADNATIDGYLTPLICREGETIEREQYSYEDSEGTSYSMEVYCVDDDGERRDETTRWEIMSAAATVPTLGIGILLFVLGVNINARRKKATATNLANYPSGTHVDLDSTNAPFGAGTSSMFGSSDPSASFGSGMVSSSSSSSSSAGKSLAERLQELQDARDAGMVTADEYDRLRKEILDSNL
jgi:hypothetical protein